VTYEKAVAACRAKTSSGGADSLCDSARIPRTRSVLSGIRFAFRRTKRMVRPFPQQKEVNHVAVAASPDPNG
jgi:hypothetical protein